LYDDSLRKKLLERHAPAHHAATSSLDTVRENDFPYALAVIQALPFGFQSAERRMTDHDPELLSDAEKAALSEVMLAPNLPPLRALVVDDDADSRDLLAQILELHEVQCVTASSAADALRLLSDRTIGLLITDLRMVPTTGLELIRQVRTSERAALPIIIISGDAGVRDAIAAMHLSVVDFLLKPIDALQLVSLARRELGLG
jgi:two-component system OmpR family response regulator